MSVGSRLGRLVLVNNGENDDGGSGYETPDEEGDLTVSGPS